MSKNFVRGFVSACVVGFCVPASSEEVTFERGIVSFDSAGAGAVFARCAQSMFDQSDAVCEVFASDMDGLRCLFVDAAGQPLGATTYDSVVHSGFWLVDLDGSKVADAICVRD
jgi:hypothetical protein